MIKHLRRRFTAVLMSLLGLVMLCVLAAIYISMYQSEQKAAERTINFAMELNFSSDFHSLNIPKMEEKDNAPDNTPPLDFVPDIRFENNDFNPHAMGDDRQSTGWVSITLDSQNNIENIFYSQRRFDYGEQLSQEESTENADTAITAAAAKIIAATDSKGLIVVDDVAYRYEMRQKGDKSVIVLLDRKNEISTLSRLLIILLSIFVLSLIVLFVLSIFLSKWAVIPIEDAWNRQKGFFSNASHELKTPLTVISANLDVITSNPDDTVAEQEKWFGYIRYEADKMSRLINEMLYISREERTDSKTIMALFDFSEAVEGACLAMEAVAFEKGKSIITQLEENLTVKGDKESLTRVVNILIDNAVAHSSEHSEITVNLKKSRNKVKLSISNQGNQIPKDELDKIFDRYYRTDASRSSGGFGLGLAIAKTVVEKHGGSISAESTEKLTTFTVII